MKESLIKCVFTYDNNCEILVPEEGFCDEIIKLINNETQNNSLLSEI